jgi:hypothetical protein
MKAFALAGLIFTVVGLGISSTAPTYQGGSDCWQRIDADCLFAFTLPPDMKRSNAGRPWGGYSRAYSGKSVPSLSFNYGTGGSCGPSNYDSAQPENEESMVEVKGRKARLTIIRRSIDKGFIAMICFPDIGAGKKRLFVSAVCLDHDGVELAKQIFGTVEFPK